MLIVQPLENDFIERNMIFESKLDIEIAVLLNAISRDAIYPAGASLT